MLSAATRKALLRKLQARRKATDELIEALIDDDGDHDSTPRLFKLIQRMLAASAEATDLVYDTIREAEIANRTPPEPGASRRTRPRAKLHVVA